MYTMITCLFFPIYSLFFWQISGSVGSGTEPFVAYIEIHKKERNNPLLPESENSGGVGTIVVYAIRRYAELNQAMALERPCTVSY
ncbi:MAG TPA: hypothetical protein VNN20_00955 [Thermodesulfobacteriota bacterium]|nr:hypothetical protein [Thermodesulfobacteriota bacterium]